MDAICDWIVGKMQIEMPDLDTERAEVIKYGLQLIIGEFPKFILLFTLGFILNIGCLTLFAFVSILPYRIVAGGFHLNTHIGCLLCTCGFYIGNVLFSQYLSFIPYSAKYIIIIVIVILSAINIQLYAPADTINVPILREKERKIKKALSFIFCIGTLICAAIIRDNVISNILIINVLFESFSISRIAYKITKNEYGYENFKKDQTIYM